MLIFDIFINLNTGFFGKGNTVTGRAEIMKHYFYENFFYDFICILPYIIDLC